MDKVHEVGWCIASALKATQRASKSSWFLACSSCLASKSSWFLACSSCFSVSPFAELLEEGCSFNFCVHAVQCLPSWKCQKESQAYSSLGHGKMKAGIASIVSLLTQQPRALEKHARLLVTMRKRILGQSPAAGTRCAMLITQRSDAQRPQRQICSLWYSILISECLPLVTLV